MNIELYIEHKLVELSDKITYSINRQFEDLNDPTKIINDWSKTINVPGTEANNILFGQIFSAQQMIVGGGTTGIQFDPTRKLDMSLMYNGCLVLHGYAKLNSITRKSGKTTYNLTLNGQLGALFQQYKKFSFNRTDGDDYIDTAQYWSKKMNKELIHNAWNDRTPHITDLDTAIELGYSNSIIGFTPNESFSEDFDALTYEIIKDGKAQTVKFEDELKDITAFAQTGVSASSVVGDGITPRGIGDFRSYNQIPYLYVNKLFQMFQRKAEAVSGYKWVYDKGWFNDANPYWTDLVMQLQTLASAETTSISSRFRQAESDDQTFTYNVVSHTVSPDGHSPRITAYKETQLLFTETMNTDYLTYSNGWFIKKTTDEIMLQFQEMNVGFSVGVYNDRFMPFGGMLIGMDSHVGLECTLKFVGRSGKTLGQHKVLIGAPDCRISKDVYDEFIEYQQYWVLTPNEYTLRKFNIRRDIGIVVPEDFKIVLGWQLLSTTSDDVYMFHEFYPSGELIDNGTLNIGVGSTLMTINAIAGYNRSNANVTLSSFWKGDVAPFDEILRYCKTFGIIVSVDEPTKTVNFKQRADFFKGYKILDWTDKVDYSKDFNITPVNTDKKYMKLQYEDSDLQFNKLCKNETGYNYGEFRLETGYQFNDETKDIMPKSNLPLVLTDTMFSYAGLKSGQIVYVSPKDEYVGCKDEDGKYIPQFGAWYLVPHDAARAFDLTLILSFPFITDDTLLMDDHQTFTYYGGVDRRYAKQTARYTKLGMVTEKDALMFGVRCLSTYGVPTRSYTYVSNIQGDAKAIYDIVWERWLTERLNVQNKMVTCYVNLNAVDYANFEFNNFVKIDGMLYMVNKIYDYDITSIKPTKVDLLLISDVKAYTELPYIDNDIALMSYSLGYIRGGLTEAGTWYGNTGVYSVKEPTFANGEKEITVGGLHFRLISQDRKMLDQTYYNYAIEYEAVEKYRGEDVVYQLEVTNGADTKNLTFTRYHDLPNPPTMSIYPTAISGANGEFTIEVRTENGIESCTVALRSNANIADVPSALSAEVENEATGKDLYTGGSISKDPTEIVVAGLTFTVDPWEEHNDDYHYWSTTVHYTSTIIDRLIRTVDVNVTTGAGYELTGTLQYAR